MPNLYDFNRIAVMWRPAKGHRRICIGTVQVPRNGVGLKFEYDSNGIAEAQKVDPDFSGLPGLPMSGTSFPSDILAEVIFGRLINNARNDVGEFYDFWLVDRNRSSDQLYILAQTQGFSFSDMFEFVPQYFTSHKHSFITDIAGLSRYGFDLTTLKRGDKIDFTLERDNKFDPNAVYVSKNGAKIGYIKKGHNTIFNRKNTKSIKLSVWNTTTIEGYEQLYLRVDIH